MSPGRDIGAPASSIKKEKPHNQSDDPKDNPTDPKADDAKDDGWKDATGHSSDDEGQHFIAPFLIPPPQVQM